MDEIKINNIISHPCLFCGKPVELHWNKRTHKCTGTIIGTDGEKRICGMIYHYRPNKGHKPGKGYLERQRIKHEAELVHQS